MICKICRNIKENKVFKIREMMFAFRYEFIYFECSKCGCLQTAEIHKKMRNIILQTTSHSKKTESNFVKHILKVREINMPI